MATPKKKDEQDIMRDAMARTAQEQQQSEDTVQPKGTPKAKGKTKGKTTVKQRVLTKNEAMITYIPLEAEDLARTMVAGIKFEANVPKKVTNPEVIKTLSTNPWFSIDGKPPPKRAKPLPPRDTSEDTKARDDIDEKKEIEVEDVINGVAEPFSEDVN